MAAAAAQALRDTVELEPNVPTEIALRFATGKPVETRFGKRVMFSLVDERVLFLDLGLAQKVHELRVRPGEPFFVQLKWSGRRGDPKDIVAWLSPETEKRRAIADAQVNGDTWTAKRLERSIEKTREIRASVMGTPASPGAGREIVERAKQMAEQAQGPEPAAAAPDGRDKFWSEQILGRATGLIDIYAGALKYAGRHSGQVSAEDVRWMVAAAFVGDAIARRPK